MAAFDDRDDAVMSSAEASGPEFKELSAYIEGGFERLRSRYPDVWAKLNLVQEGLGASTTVEDYQAIGLICRDAMILFANGIFSPDFVPKGKATPREDDTHARIELTLQNLGQLAGSDAERKLAKEVWRYAVRLQHNQDATRQQAQRTVVYCMLSIIDVALLVDAATHNSQLVQKWGRYKCGGCGSTQIEEERYDDWEGPGPTFLVCQKCNWQEIE